jgi:hypothetical protein
MNKTPCIEPATLTTSGIPMKYFIGIATNNKVRNEIPSANAIILKALIWLIFMFLPFSRQIYKVM